RRYIAKTLLADEEEEEAPQSNHVVEEPKVLGLHPVSKEKILMKKGPYGFYVQLGEDRKDYIPKRTSLAHVCESFLLSSIDLFAIHNFGYFYILRAYLSCLQVKDVDAVTLEESLKLLRYPMTLVHHLCVLSHNLLFSS
ncbi:hypothetical protein LINPERPRIM_LOCUS35330, partial [Linum perenne]